MRKPRSFDSRIDLELKARIQYEYIKNKDLFKDTYRGAKRYTYMNNEFNISRAQAGRYMKECDTWQDELVAIFIRMYELK